MSKQNTRKERETLLRLLREMRVQAGLRQADVARRLGQPQPFVSRYESGERRLDILELRKLCEVCGLSPADFYRRLDQMLNEA